MSAEAFASGAFSLRFFVSSALAFAVAPSLAHAQAAPPKQPPPDALTPASPISIVVNARPIASFDLRDRSLATFGQLRYRSGLQLTSPWRGFGGLSALRVDETGERFVAISDKGAWLTGRIDYRDTEMTGLSDVETAPMLGPEGRPITARGWYDTEALARDGGAFYVGLERVNQILRFDFARDGLRSLGQPIALPPGLRKLPNNKGLEALVVMPAASPLRGALLAISERGLDAQGNIVGALIGGAKPGGLSVRRTEDYDVSDAALLPSGDLLLLERKFSWLGGIGVRIRRIASVTLLPGAVLDGRTIFEADLGNEIDNLEGLDVHVTAAGDTVLTMISDDNFSLLQRTLLLQFTLLTP